MDTLGDRIKNLRRIRNLSQDEIATAMGKSKKQVVSSWENNRHEPSLADLHKLAELLGTSVGYLVDGRVDQDAELRKQLLDTQMELNEANKRLLEYQRKEIEQKQRELEAKEKELVKQKHN